MKPLVAVASVAVALCGVASASAANAAPIRVINVGQTVTLKAYSAKPGDTVGCRIGVRTYTARVPALHAFSGKDLLSPAVHSLELSWLSSRRLRFSCK